MRTRKSCEVAKIERDPFAALLALLDFHAPLHDDHSLPLDAYPSTAHAELEAEMPMLLDPKDDK
jgi:hypothetical protein